MSHPCQVEKAHANIQTDLASLNHASKRAYSIQKDSFIMSVCLEHSRLKSAVEEEVLGTKKRSVYRVLSSRVVESTAPGASLSQRKQRFGSTRRRMNGALQGLGTIQCGQVRKHHIKTRRMSGYNAFQTMCK